MAEIYDPMSVFEKPEAFSHDDLTMPKIAHLSSTIFLLIMAQLLSVYGRYILLMLGKKLGRIG